MNDFSAIWGVIRPPPFALASKSCPWTGALSGVEGGQGW